MERFSSTSDSTHDKASLGRMVTNLWYIPILLIFLAGCGQSRNPQYRVVNTYPPDSLNDLVLENLCTRKVVMLGNGQHQNGYYMRMVTGVLGHWVDELESQRREMQADARKGAVSWSLLGHSSRIPKKLFLFVEADSAQAAALNHYMRTGDIFEWLKLLIQGETRYGRVTPSGVSTANAEYLYELRRIKERIDELNGPANPRKYGFRIVCPEGNPSYVNDLKFTRDVALDRERYEKFVRARFEYFLKYRDKMTSTDIRDTLAANPGYKALVFYGTAHLLRGLRNKGEFGKPRGWKGDTLGYFMAHYLDKYYSRDSVAVFNTFNTSEPGRGEIAELARKRTAPDYDVACDPQTLIPFPIDLVNCRLTLRAFLQLKDGNERGKEEGGVALGEEFALHLARVLRGSYLYSDGSARSSIDSLIRSGKDTSERAERRFDEIANRLTEGFDAVRNIDLLDKWFPLRFKSDRFQFLMLRNILMSLPMISKADRERLRADSPGANAGPLIKRYGKDLKEYYLVELMWLAGPGMRVHARDDLERLTGVKLQTPEQWSQWWRGKYRD